MDRDINKEDINKLLETFSKVIKKVETLEGIVKENIPGEFVLLHYKAKSQKIVVGLPEHVHWLGLTYISVNLDSYFRIVP